MRLRSLWSRALVRGPSALSRDQLRTTARAVSMAARDAGLQAEQLITAVKASWRDHTGFRNADERFHTEWLLTDVVSLCIREFYREPPVSSPVSMRLTRRELTRR